MIRTPLLLAAGLTVVASPVMAQDLLERMARAAVERAATAAAQRAAGAAVSAATAQHPAPAGTPPPSARASAAQAPGAAGRTSFAAPAPINYSAALQSPRQLEFSAEDAGGKQRLMEFSRFSCDACEGGRAYGSWIGHYVSSLFGDGLPRRVQTMRVGDKIDWQVPQMGGSGRMEVINDQPIGPWACKQIRWTITRSQQSESRLGLFCEMSGSATGWFEIL
ncbi:hypothetical protein [Brevundimonas sp. Root1423]|uniref:hypothetical protein n=1 Tax=Brevundimonas sp. Root1423 TaxID=1736462 RepID=UPI0006FB12E4|nr:hypothetical protein [Brevundimonas sp. Root1423]KQY85881.1 hypothetical protein ASD25_23335 [Brevundimonas sp. Root1423]